MIETVLLLKRVCVVVFSTANVERGHQTTATLSLHLPGYISIPPHQQVTSNSWEEV